MIQRGLGVFGHNAARMRHNAARTMQTMTYDDANVALLRKPRPVKANDVDVA